MDVIAGPEHKTMPLSVLCFVIFFSLRDEVKSMVGKHPA
jgi:hypothetical protein